jgi:uncharacterized protein (TIGR02300 family)
LGLPGGVDGIATHIDEIEPMAVASASQSNKAARGTKRVCDACQVRFYDLLRDPIVCPSCGAQHTPVVQPVFEAGRRAAPTGGKTGWRQSVKRPAPVLPAPDPEIAIPAEAVADEVLEVATEEATEAVPDDDIVLEQEPDDADVSGLVDHDVEEPKER